MPSEDSDQHGHPPSLIRFFAVRMKKAWVLSYPLSAQRRLIRLGGCQDWSKSSLGAHAILLVLSWGGSNVFVKHYAPNRMLAHKDNTRRVNINILLNLAISWSSHLQLGHNLYVSYHDPSSSGSPVILFTRLCYNTKCQSRKRDIIQPNIYRILWNIHIILRKVNQVIYTMYPNCTLDIVTLA